MSHCISNIRDLFFSQFDIHVFFLSNKNYLKRFDFSSFLPFIFHCPFLIYNLIYGHIFSICMHVWPLSSNTFRLKIIFAKSMPMCDVTTNIQNSPLFRLVGVFFSYSLWLKFQNKSVSQQTMSRISAIDFWFLGLIPIVRGCFSQIAWT